MAQPEPSEIWVNVFEVLGLAFGGGLMAWIRSYLKGRAEESEHRPELPARAIGAAFVDRAASDALISISGDVKVIRTLAEQRVVQADKRTLLEEAARVAREEAARVRERGHHRSEDDD